MATVPTALAGRTTASPRRRRAPASRHRPARWLLVRGGGGRPLPPIVERGAITGHYSSRRPTLETGDLAILYAAVWQAIFGLVEVTGVPEHDPARERWSWRFPVRPVVLVGDLHDAPPVEAAGIFPQSLWRHSYIRLTEEQFGTARALLEERGA